MNNVWARRREEVLRDCLVSSDVFTPIVERLGEFVLPYQRALETEASERHVRRAAQRSRTRATRRSKVVTRMVKKLMRPRARSISAAPRAVHDTESDLHALRLG